jgi:hypothetical protein
MSKWAQEHKIAACLFALPVQIKISHSPTALISFQLQVYILMIVYARRPKPIDPRRGSSCSLPNFSSTVSYVSNIT